MQVDFGLRAPIERGGGILRLAFPAKIPRIPTHFWACRRVGCWRKASGIWSEYEPPPSTLALESYIRLHGNITPEQITELGYLGIYEPSVLTPEQKTYLDRMRSDDPVAYKELCGIAKSAHARFKQLRRSVLSADPDPGRCSRWIPFAHAVTGFLICALIIWLF